MTPEEKRLAKNAYMVEWRRKNPEKAKAAQERWRKKHPETFRAMLDASRKRYLATPEGKAKTRAARKRWTKTPRGREVINRFKAKKRAAVLGRRCVSCGKTDRQRPWSNVRSYCSACERRGQRVGFCMACGAALKSRTASRGDPKSRRTFCPKCAPEPALTPDEKRRHERERATARRRALGIKPPKPPKPPKVRACRFKICASGRPHFTSRPAPEKNPQEKRERHD